MTEPTYTLTEEQMQEIIGMLLKCESALMSHNDPQMACKCWRAVRWIDDIKAEVISDE